MKIFKRTRHYLNVYSGFLSNSFSEAMNFRVHFILLIVMDLFFYFSALASVNIIYNHVETIGPWNRDQLSFFLSVMLAVNQLHMTFISQSFWEMVVILRKGDLDFTLLKPIGSIFIVFFRYIRPGSFMNIFVTWGCVIYFGLNLNLSWVSWVMLPFLILLGFILSSSLDMVIACSMFWMLEGTGINFLRMELQQLSRWPDFIYSGVIRKALTVVVPVLLIGNAPVRFLFNYQDWIMMAGLFAAIAVSWALLKVLWQAGLNQYESASS